ncbi:hypothetical protein B0H13DRAFT_316589 [Mycena leptocephala]|nr:hypothetical protein B0H13DRAFT_316589 [Mycena leptocephala]
MSVALLSDFCYRKNTESGSLHRDGIVYDGHYDPWIEDDIDILYQSLPFDQPRETRPGYLNVSLFERTQESFFISELPQHIRDSYNIPPHDHPLRTNTDITPLPLVDLSGARTCRYEFLAAAQNTKFALVPIHTNEEYALFNSAVRPGGQFGNQSSGPPNFKEMTKWWSTRANGKAIFFKIPEHLQNHHKVRKAVRDEMTTMHKTATDRQEFTQLVPSDAYASVVLSESFSPVVKTRNTTSNATSIASHVAAEGRVAATEALSVPLTSLESSARPAAAPQTVFVQGSSRSPLPPPADFRTTAGGGQTLKQPPKRKECAVCRSVKQDGSDCPGRGGRRLCKWYGTPGLGRKR